MLDANDLALPGKKHLPGINERPDNDYLHSIAQQAAAKTADDRAGENLPWMYGIRLINEGFYWEAHEVLEPVWMNAAPNSRIRFLVQCLIHITNARLKLALKQERAAKRLQLLAETAAERAFPDGEGQLMNLAASIVLSVAGECGDASMKCYLHAE